MILSLAALAGTARAEADLPSNPYPDLAPQPVLSANNAARIAAACRLVLGEPAKTEQRKRLIPKLEEARSTLDVDAAKLKAMEANVIKLRAALDKERAKNPGGDNERKAREALKNAEGELNTVKDLDRQIADHKSVLARTGCSAAAVAFCNDPLHNAWAPIANELPVMEQECVRPLGVANVTDKSEQPFGGASWQSEVLSGIVSFLVERAKAEALATLVDHLKTDVCTSDGKVIMPTTCGLLANTQPYTDPVAWGTLKAAFETDLRALPERMFRRLTANANAEPLRVIVQAATLIEKGKDPVEVMVGLKTKYAAIKTKADCVKYPDPCALELFGLATEILAPTNASATKSADAEARVLQIKIAARLFYEGATPLGMPDILADDRVASTLDALSSIRDALAKLRNLNKQAQDAVNGMSGDGAGKKKEKPDARSVYIEYVRAVAISLKGVPTVALIPELQQHIDVTQLQLVIEHLTLAVDHGRAGEYIQAFVELQAALSAAKLPVPAWFSKYGGFIAEVAAAKDKDDVKRVLESAAAPVGAWRTKRGDGHHTLTLNGYVGLQGGYEWLSGEDTNGSVHYGLFAPIGIEASYGFCKTWSIGAFLSVLDLGALVDVRTDDEGNMVETTSNAGFRQVFSPGFYAVLGLGRVPFTLGAGVSLAPQLRSVTFRGTESDENALRVNVFLATDIVIFGF